MISRYTHGKGFSLVELMVALLLGSLVTIVALQLLGTNQRAFRLQQSLLDVQEQGRFALDYIARDLRMMGYVQMDPTGTPVMTGVGLQTTDSVAGGITYPGSANNEGGTGNDRLTFSFYGIEDCEGDRPAAEDLIINSYWVQNGELRCIGSVDPATRGIVLVSGVESFQVLAGVDEVQDSNPFASRYVTANNVAGQVVVAVRVALLVASEQPQQDLGDPEDFVVLDEALDGAADLQEDLIRRLFTTTVKARNYNWEAI